MEVYEELEKADTLQARTAVTIKVAVVGDPGVGKTEYLIRACESNIDDDDSYGYFEKTVSFIFFTFLPSGVCADNAVIHNLPGHNERLRGTKAESKIESKAVSHETSRLERTERGTMSPNECVSCKPAILSLF